MSQIAFAAIDDGKILVNTLSSTTRAAKVNWLVTEAKVMVFSQWSDGDIERAFDRLVEQKGSKVSIKQVIISVLPDLESSSPEVPHEVY